VIKTVKKNKKITFQLLLIMRKVGRPPKNKTPAIEDLPEDFRLAFIKVMATFGIGDVREGYRRAAILLDRNSEEYIKNVNTESERKYRSRHFTEMNKTRRTWEKEAYDRGHHQGYRVAEDTFKITYFCSICDKTLTMMPNANDHLAAQRYMREHEWAHSTCHKK
jgi:hypothetical protein